MMRNEKGDNMTLTDYVKKLCEDLTTLKNKEWSHCAEEVLTTISKKVVNTSK